MNGVEIEANSGDDLVRLVKALGQHRYVAGRLHLVHALAVEAACEGEAPAALEEARRWAQEVLADPDVDVTSKDERLHRRATDAELVAVLASFWGANPHRASCRDKLARRLAAIGATGLDPSRLPFDESLEEDLFPVLVDAGYELVPLGALDPQRHKGALDAFEDPFALQVARFEEENAAAPVVALNELPALGGLELLHALDEEGRPRAPFVVWTAGNETYVDYVLRGVLRAAKLAT